MDERVRIALLGLIALSFASVLLGVFHQRIAGDEFIFLQSVHRAANDEPLGILQTAHVHLFSWLTHVDGWEIAQIRLARLLYVAIWGGSLALLYKLAVRLMDPLAALVSVTLFALFSYSIMNAASFRVDGLLLPLLIAVAILLTNPTTLQVAAAGALSGVAAALSVKAILWAPSLAGALAAGLWYRHDRLYPILAGALTAGCTFGAIIVLHAWLIATESSGIPTVSGKTLSWMGYYMLGGEGLSPKWKVFVAAVKENPLTWALLLLGLFLAIRDLRHPRSRPKALVLLALALPITSITFYTNAFPYAYLMLFPTACLLAGRASSELMRLPSRSREAAILTCMLVAALPLVAISAYYVTDRQRPQRELISMVHERFREPVPYIDAGGAIANFPRLQFFWTDFGVIGYREQGDPIISEYIREHRPPLFIANRAVLDVWPGGAAERLEPRLRLLPRDEETIRATYARFWGPIYLAGREWRDLGAGDGASFEIIMPGKYTLVSHASVVVDGRLIPSGGVLTLEAGRHAMRTTGPEPHLRILWGQDVRIPASRAAPQLLEREAAERS